MSTTITNEIIIINNEGNQLDVPPNYYIFYSNNPK